MLKENPRENEEELKKQVKELQQQLQKAIQEKKEYEEQYYKNIILNLIIKRYSKCINEKEIKTIEGLKALIQPNNPKIVELKNSIVADTKTDKIKQAYEIIFEKVKSVSSLGVNFWMTIEEMIETGIADYEDKAILLCSLLKALEIDSKIAIAELNDGSNKPFILIEEGEESLLLDPNLKHNFNKYKGTIEELIKNYEENSQKISRFLYKFDNQEYEELI